MESLARIAKKADQIGIIQMLERFLLKVKVLFRFSGKDPEVLERTCGWPDIVTNPEIAKAWEANSTPVVEGKPSAKPVGGDTEYLPLPKFLQDYGEPKYLERVRRFLRVSR